MAQLSKSLVSFKLNLNVKLVICYFHCDHHCEFGVNLALCDKIQCNALVVEVKSRQQRPNSDVAAAKLYVGIRM